MYNFSRILAVALLVGSAGAGAATGPQAVKAARPINAPQRAVSAVADFNVSGNWKIFQSDGATVQVYLTQDGNGIIYGTASFREYVGTIRNGFVSGNNIAFTLEFTTGTRNRYTGSRQFDGRISGQMFVEGNPNHQTTWITTRTF